MAETKEKAVLMTIETVRIKEYDNLNVTIERYEEIYNPIDKEITRKWRFKGYSSTILSALKYIATKELLIDKNAVCDLKSYLNEIRRTNTTLIKALEGVANEIRRN